MSLACPNPLGAPAFCVDPYSAPQGGLTTSREVAKAADVSFDSGRLSGPCFVGRPESGEATDVVRSLLRESQLAFVELV